MTHRIYLDNAATSWPKPESVYQAVDRYQREVGAAAGRGGYDHGQQASQIIARTRTLLQKFFHAPLGSDFVFTFNGTDALNLCLLGTLDHGDHVITTAIEHNSILRPLAHLRQTRQVEVTYVSPDDHGIVRPADILAALRPDTKLVAMTQASNVTGCLQPIHEIGQVARKHGVWFLVDAAQTAGHEEIDLSTLGIDMLAMSGHKGLLGPLGTGLVFFAPGVAEQVTPLRMGGTGTQSQSEGLPQSGPLRFEAGNLNVPGIAGLHAGLEFLIQQADTVTESDRAMAAAAWDGLAGISGVRLLGPGNMNQRVGLVSFTLEGFDCHDVASILDSNYGVQVRAGLHCAPRIHEHLGLNGSVRASWGPFSTLDDITQLCHAVAELAGSGG